VNQLWLHSCCIPARLFVNPVAVFGSRVPQKYENNLKKGLLTDNTIMLWNERCAAAAAAGVAVFNAAAARYPYICAGCGIDCQAHAAVQQQQQ
jgi:hypothetical protein